MGMNSLPKTCYLTASRLRFEPRPFSTWVQHANHLATTMWKLEVDGKMVSECLSPGMLAHSRTDGQPENNVSDWLTEPSYRTSEGSRLYSIMAHNTHTHNNLTAPCPGLPGWASTRRNIHPLKSTLIVKHPISTSSIYYDPWYTPPWHMSFYKLTSTAHITD